MVPCVAPGARGVAHRSRPLSRRPSPCRPRGRAHRGGRAGRVAGDGHPQSRQHLRHAAGPAPRAGGRLRRGRRHRRAPAERVDGRAVGRSGLPGQDAGGLAGGAGLRAGLPDRRSRQPVVAGPAASGDGDRRDRRVLELDALRHLDSGVAPPLRGREPEQLGFHAGVRLQRLRAGGPAFPERGAGPDPRHSLPGRPGAQPVMAPAAHRRLRARHRVAAPGLRRRGRTRPGGAAPKAPDRPPARRHHRVGAVAAGPRGRLQHQHDHQCVLPGGLVARGRRPARHRRQVGVGRSPRRRDPGGAHLRRGGHGGLRLQAPPRRRHRSPRMACPDRARDRLRRRRVGCGEGGRASGPGRGAGARGAGARGMGARGHRRRGGAGPAGRLPLGGHQHPRGVRHALSTDGGDRLHEGLLRRPARDPGWAEEDRGGA